MNPEGLLPHPCRFKLLTQPDIISSSALLNTHCPNLSCNPFPKGASAWALGCPVSLSPGSVRRPTPTADWLMHLLSMIVYCITSLLWLKKIASTCRVLLCLWPAWACDPGGARNHHDGLGRVPTGQIRELRLPQGVIDAETDLPAQNSLPFPLTQDWLRWAC